VLCKVVFERKNRRVLYKKTDRTRPTVPVTVANTGNTDYLYTGMNPATPFLRVFYPLLDYCNKDKELIYGNKRNYNRF
jgi:hypothetical protein